MDEDRDQIVPEDLDIPGFDEITEADLDYLMPEPPLRETTNALIERHARLRERRILRKLREGRFALVLSPDVAEELNEATSHPLVPYDFPGIFVEDELDPGTLQVLRLTADEHEHLNPVHCTPKLRVSGLAETEEHDNGPDMITDIDLFAVGIHLDPDGGESPV